MINIIMSFFEKQTSSPLQSYIRWSGSEGNFIIYDINTKETKILDKIFFIPLTKRSCITGWYDPNQSNIYSNEIKDIKEVVTVVANSNKENNTSKKILVSGAWKDIKDQVKSFGGKYTQSHYIMFISDPKKRECELANIRMSGAFLGEWFQFEPQTNDGSIVVIEKNPEILKKGATKYYKPSFKTERIDVDLLEEAKKMYSIIQNYLEDKDNMFINGTELVEELEEHKNFGYKLKENGLPEINMDEFDKVDLPF